MHAHRWRQRQRTENGGDLLLAAPKEKEKWFLFFGFSDDWFFQTSDNGIEYFFASSPLVPCVHFPHFQIFVALSSLVTVATWTRLVGSLRPIKGEFGQFCRWIAPEISFLKMLGLRLCRCLPGAYSSRHICFLWYLTKQINMQPKKSHMKLRFVR